MKDFARARLEHMRLSILQLLEKVGADTSSPVIRSAVNQLGYRPASLRGELEWLESHGLVKLIDAGHRVTVVRLTEHGYAVAGGDERVTGVARPRPGDR